MKKKRISFKLLILFFGIFSMAIEHSNAQISFNQPNASTAWEVGTEQHILIENTGSDIEASIIELYTNANGSWEEIILVNTTLTSGINDFVWNINLNYSPGANYKLRISDAGYQVISESEVFELTAASPQIKSIISPDSDTYRINGQDLTIGWYCYSVTEVDIEYTTDNGVTWISIANNFTVTDGYNSMIWTVSGISGINGNSKIKVSESADPENNFQLSAGFFLADVEQFSFIQPNSSTNWRMITEQNINILNNGSEINNCSIKLYINGLLEEEIFSNINLSNGNNNFLWDISIYAASDNCQLKIEKLDNEVVVVSDVFELIIPEPQIMSISSPSANSYWYNGQVMSINWECYSVSEVNIEYSTDNGENWTTIENNFAVNDGNNNTMWNVTGIVGSNDNSLIKISDSSDPNNVFLESSTFILAENLGDVTITQPNSETVWEIGTEQHILVANYSGLNIDVSMTVLYLNGSIEEMIPMTYTLINGENDIIWNINNSYDASDNYYLSLINDSFQEVAVSDSFELINTSTPQILSVSSPGANNYWYNGQITSINWECYYVSEVNIEYSTDNGENWTTIENNFAVNDGNNNTMWNVTGIVGINQNSIVKVSDSSDPENVYAESSVFTLAENAQAIISEPNSDSHWALGSEQHIIVNNNMDYDIALGGFAVYVNNSLEEIVPLSETLTTGENDIIWNINLSYPPSGNCQIILFDGNFQEVAISDSFELINTSTPQILSVSSPGANNYWYNGQITSINWECYSVSEVNIEYSTDNGENWTTIETNFAVGDGSNSTTWDVTGIVGINQNSIVKVSDSSDPENVYAESSVFTLAENAQAIISEPNSDSRWALGSEQHIIVNNNMDYDIALGGFAVYVNNSLEEIVLFSGTLTTGENDIIWNINLSYPPSGNCQIILFDGDIREIAESEIFELTEPLSIAERQGRKLYVFPNPTDGIINFNISGNNNSEQIEIFDLTGKVLIRKTAVLKIEKLNLSELKRGIYFLKINLNGKISVYKIIKR